MSWIDGHHPAEVEGAAIHRELDGIERREAELRERGSGFVVLEDDDDGEVVVSPKMREDGVTVESLGAESEGLKISPMIGTIGTLGTIGGLSLKDSKTTPRTRIKQSIND